VLVSFEDYFLDMSLGAFRDRKSDHGFIGFQIIHLVFHLDSVIPFREISFRICSEFSFTFSRLRMERDVRVTFP